MTITAQGPKITVDLNDKEVSTINLDEWNRAGQAARRLETTSSARSPSVNSPRTGYLGFQDHGSDCWFKNIKIKELD